MKKLNCQILIEMKNPYQIVPSCVCAMLTDTSGLCSQSKFRKWINKCTPEICPLQVIEPIGYKTAILKNRIEKEWMLKNTYDRLLHKINGYQELYNKLGFLNKNLLHQIEKYSLDCNDCMIAESISFNNLFDNKNELLKHKFEFSEREFRDYERVIMFIYKDKVLIELDMGIETIYEYEGDYDYVSKSVEEIIKDYEFDKLIIVSYSWTGAPYRQSSNYVHYQIYNNNFFK